MIDRMHLVKLKHGKYVNLSAITAAVYRDDTVKLWYFGEDHPETFIGEDATTVMRRLEAIVFVATDTIEQDIAAVAAVPDAERPRP